MAINTKTVTIREGRDAGKVFVITEMPARAAYRWAARAIFALMNSGFEVPDELESSGLAGIAALGLKALGKASFAEMEPLLDEMLACVAIIPDPSKPGVMLGDIERHIEDAKTFFVLQKEALMLHVEPFISGDKSNGALSPGTARAG